MEKQIKNPSNQLKDSKLSKAKPKYSEAEELEFPELTDSKLEALENAVELGVEVAVTIEEGGDAGDVAEALTTGISGMIGSKLGGKVGKVFGVEENGAEIGAALGEFTGEVATELVKGIIPDLKDVDLGTDMDDMASGCWSTVKDFFTCQNCGDCFGDD